MRAILATVLVLGFSLPAFANDEELRIYSGQVSEDIFTAGTTVDVDADVSGDVFAGGGSVNIAGTVSEDAITAGGRTNLRANVAGDVISAGGTVTVTGDVGDNLIAAGGTVTVEGKVGGNAIIMGGQVEIARASVIEGDAILSGGQIIIHGRVMKNLKVVGGRVVILGEIAGNIDAKSESLVIGPGAKVAGKIYHRGRNEPEIDASATVGGPVQHVTRLAVQVAKPALAAWAASMAVIPYFFCLIVGLAVLYLAPAYAGRLRTRASGQPLASLGLGVFLTFGLPAVFLAMMITIIGIPFALAGFAAYVVMVMAGFPLGALAVSRWFAARGGRMPTRNREALTFALGLLALFIVGLIPFLGQLTLWVVWSLGVGALVLAFQIPRTAAAT